MSKRILIPFLSFCLMLNTWGQTLKDKWVPCNSQDCKVLDPYYDDGVTAKWDGLCQNGIANGVGKLMRFIDGKLESTYEGEYRNGIREGKGKVTYPDGTILEGDFVGGQMTGRGTKTWENGQKYVGNFINYRMHGNGTLEYPSGDRYEGFFVSDLRYTGTYTTNNRKSYYMQEYRFVDRIKEVRSGYLPKLGTRVTEYFDENWKRCSQQQASYYRLVTYASHNKPAGIVKDYYITGQLQSEFTAVYLDYDDEGKNFHEGEATWYFSSGKIEQKRYYLNNKTNGANTFYYENGQIASETNYHNGLRDGIFRSWYKTGKTRTVAVYELGSLVENKYVEFDENGIGAFVYHEDFSANRKEWLIEDAGNKSELTANDELLLNISNDKLTSRYNYVSFSQSNDYSIEALLQKKVGKGFEGYGLLFGFKDWDNYYQFLISEYGSYIITGEYEGVAFKISEWTKSNAINIGNKPNLLKVMKIDDEIIFSVNGQQLERTPVKNLRGNNIGILANGPGEFLLRNITVKEFVSAEELASKMPKNVQRGSDEWKGNGTGFFISEKGYIATNHHVIDDAHEIQVEYYQQGKKQTYSAKVIASDKQNDLAVLQIQDPQFRNLPPIPYVFTSVIKDAGTDVFALGYPMADIMGAEIKFTDGKISSKTGIKGDITVYQVSVPIQPGNSGGPLFDSKGNLIGIISSMLNKEYYNSENVNYAIKSSYLRNLVDVLLGPINLPAFSDIYFKSLTDKIKLISDFVPIIRVR